VRIPKIEIYTKQICPYCVRAKQLLDSKGVSYLEIPVDQDSKALEDMLSRSQGRRTVPEIFIDDRLIGGCDDLYALEQAGKLNAILNVE
jgi:GrxC family glutaredoxin